MKIWIDILTPKQLLFFEPIVAKLGKKHEILCTSRKYGEVVNLAKIRDFDIVFIGKYMDLIRNLNSKKVSIG